MIEQVRSWFHSGEAISRVSFSLLFVIAAAASGCGGPSPSQAVSTPGIIVPTGDWPPIAITNLAQPSGLTLTLTSEGIATFTNSSSQDVWVAPAQIEVWEGPSPWTEGEVREGSVRVAPGDNLSQEVTVSGRPTRLGVRVWRTSDTIPSDSNAPWFVWLDVKP